MPAAQHNDYFVIDCHSALSIAFSPVRVAEWLRSPPLDQQVDLEGLGSNPGTGKLDSSFQLSVE